MLQEYVQLRESSDRICRIRYAGVSRRMHPPESSDVSPNDPPGLGSSVLGHFAHGTALVTVAEILGDSFLVEPQPEHACKIPVAGLLKRSPQVGVPGLEPALGSEQMR